jgi:imidazolonepropionase-like amidohydrolase
MDLANDWIPNSEISIQAARFMEDMLMRGFTSIRDAGGADMGLANAVNKGLIKGPRLFYSGKALSQTGGHGDFRKANIGGDLCSCACSGSSISLVADGIDEVRKAARNEIRKGASQIKIMSSGGVASPTDRVSNLQYSIEEMRAIVEEAHNAGIYVMAHAYTPEAISRCVEAGVRSIEHGNLLNESTAELMAKKGAYLVPTLVVYESLADLGPKLHYPPESLAKVKDVKEAGLEAIKIARSKGVKIGFGTDLLGTEGQTWQAKEFLIRSAVESPYDIIHSATLVNAEILNQVAKLGVIAPGAFADLLVVNGDPLKDIGLLAAQGEALDLIMKEGVIYKNRLI